MTNLRTCLLAFLVAVLVSSARGQMFWNQAASFNGTSSYIAVNPSTPLNITGSFTLEAWINPASVSVDFAGLISKGFSSSRRYSLNFASGTTANRIEIATNGSQRIRSSAPIVAGVWTHVAGVYDNATNTFQVYINGALDTSAVVSGAAPPDGPTDSTFIGKTSTGRFFGGIIDDARVWNRALTGAEIRKWMRTELGANSGVYSGLVLSMIFESSISTGGFNLFDFSGTGNQAFNRGAIAVNYSSRPYTYTTMNDCVHLDGTGDYLAGTSTTALDITGNFTVECWVNPTNVVSPSFQILVSKRSLAGSNGYDMYLNGGRVAIRTNGSTRLLGATAVPNGAWSHVAATFNSSTGVFSVYVNGNLDGSATVSGASPTTNADSLFIGHGFNSDYAGYIDEVRIIPLTRTQQEIRSFMTRSMDGTNEASPSNTIYNLDGIAYANGSTVAFPFLQFRGDAAFAAVSTVSNQPLSPLNRSDAQNFPQGFYLKYSDRRIPQTGTSGPMVPDSLFISQSVSITDINFYIATNHTYDADMSIALIDPTGDSVNV